MREFEVWSEGYICTGESSTANFHGKWPGETFKDAVISWRSSLNEESAVLVHVDRMVFWGCGLFDNESQAREAFG